MPRGGGLAKVQVSFKKVKDMTLGEVYGTKPITKESGDNLYVSDLHFMYHYL